VRTFHYKIHVEWSSERTKSERSERYAEHGDTRANVVSDMQSMEILERTLSGAMSERYAKNVCKNKNARTLGSPLVSLMITH
jgi:hypothetical protein